jgi:hypothetical protein
MTFRVENSRNKIIRVLTYILGHDCMNSGATLARLS